MLFYSHQAISWTNVNQDLPCYTALHHIQLSADEALSVL